MSDILTTDPKLFRSCILFQFLRKKSVDEVNKSMYEAMGDKVDYSEVDFWYYRFYQGNFDLDYDRSLDPKSATLSDLPFDVLKKIVRKLDWKERLVTRKVCKGLRTIVDQQQPVYYNIVKVNVFDSSVEVTYKNVIINYKQDEEDCLIECHPGNSMTIENANFAELAFNDLSIALQNLKLGSFEVDLLCAGKANCKRFHEFLKSMKIASNVHVKETCLQMTSFQTILSLLKLMEPGKLKKIDLDIRGISAALFMKLVEMEQWKQAKEVVIHKHYFLPNQFEHFYHFNRFELSVSSMTAEGVVQLLDDLSKSVNFKACLLHLRYGTQSRIEIGRAIGGNIDEFDEFTQRRPIHGSKDILEIKIKYPRFEIRRKSPKK